MLVKRDWAMLTDNNLSLPANFTEPFTKFLSVRDGSGERDDLDALHQMDKDLFPNSASELVSQVMHFIHDYTT